MLGIDRKISHFFHSLLLLIWHSVFYFLSFYFLFSSNYFKWILSKKGDNIEEKEIDQTRREISWIRFSCTVFPGLLFCVLDFTYLCVACFYSRCYNLSMYPNFKLFKWTLSITNIINKCLFLCFYRSTDLNNQNYWSWAYNFPYSSLIRISYWLRKRMRFKSFSIS